MNRRLIPILIMIIIILSACHRAQTGGPGKRYHFTGRVISIDPRSESAFIYGDDVPGFMESMGMSYKIKPASTLSALTPGDLISADVVMEPNPKDESAGSDYWLENVKVTGHVKPAAKPTVWRGPSAAFPLPEIVIQNRRSRGNLSQREGDTIHLAVGRV